MKLSDLLVGVRKELREAEDKKRNEGLEPAYLVSSINVELLVENVDEVDGGIDLKIVNLGATGEVRNLHKISVTLTPLEMLK